MKRLKCYIPSLGECWTLVAVMLFGMLVVGLSLGFVWPGAPQSVTYGLGMVFPIAFAIWRGNQNKNAGAESVPLDNTRLGATKPLEYGILLLIALLSLVIVIEPATAFIPMPESVKHLFEKAFLDCKTPDLIVSTCILAPLCEELLCRGVMMRGLLATGKSARSAILWSAFIFALIHMNPWQSIPAFAFGAFFGWVYWRTGSLWTTITLHAVNNGISAAIAKIWPDLGMDVTLMDLLPTEIYVAVFVASAALFVFAISALNRKLDKNE